MNSAIEQYYDSDFTETLGSGDTIFIAKTFSNIKYNQKLVGNYSCTGQAACGVISDVTGLSQDVIDKTAMNGTILPLSFRKRVRERQLETGATEKGDYLQNGMKQAVKLFNEESPELPYILKYYRISDLKNVRQLMSILNHSSIHTGYTGALYEDAQDNGVIDNNDNKDGYGHSIRIVKAWYEGGKLSIKYCDNYEGVNDYSIIEVPDFLNNKNFFTGGYYCKKVAKSN